jgi:hypothetical protein
MARNSGVVSNQREKMLVPRKGKGKENTGGIDLDNLALTPCSGCPIPAAGPHAMLPLALPGLFCRVRVRRRQRAGS